MEKFTIKANQFLNSDITAYYHDDYKTSDSWYNIRTIKGVICVLKNDISKKTPPELNNVMKIMANILEVDLQLIYRELMIDNLMVCVVPRAKANYPKDELLFSHTVNSVVDKIQNISNGVNCIKRVKDTRTTHRNKSGHGGQGDLPYVGITKDTCEISECVKGKDILLIDDLYTESVNIDEDAIQALFDAGASSVHFYSLGKTI